MIECVASLVGSPKPVQLPKMRDNQEPPGSLGRRLARGSALGALALVVLALVVVDVSVFRRPGVVDSLATIALLAVLLPALFGGVLGLFLSGLRAALRRPPFSTPRRRRRLAVVAVFLPRRVPHVS